MDTVLIVIALAQLAFGLFLLSKHYHMQASLTYIRDEAERMNNFALTMIKTNQEIQAALLDAHSKIENM